MEKWQLTDKLAPPQETQGSVLNLGLNREISLRDRACLPMKTEDKPHLRHVLMFHSVLLDQEGSGKSGYDVQRSL